MDKQFDAALQAIVDHLDPAQRDQAQRDIEAIRRVGGATYSRLLAILRDTPYSSDYST